MAALGAKHGGILQNALLYKEYKGVVVVVGGVQQGFTVQSPEAVEEQRRWWCD